MQIEQLFAPVATLTVDMNVLVTGEVRASRAPSPGQIGPHNPNLHPIVVPEPER